MSNLKVVTAEMHKVADLDIKVKYRRPGNVVGYVPVEFEIFKDGEYFKAIPLATIESKRLTNLPAQLLFQLKNRTIYTIDKTGKEKEEVIEDIVNELFDMNIAEVSQKKVEKTENVNSHFTVSRWIPDFIQYNNLKKPIFFTICEQRFIEQCRLKYLEIHKLAEIKDFYEYEKQFTEIITELSQKLSTGKIPASRLKSTLSV